MLALPVRVLVVEELTAAIRAIPACVRVVLLKMLAIGLHPFDQTSK